MNTVYIVMKISTEQYVQITPNHKVPIALSWADGMIGAMSVFDTKEAAEAYADGESNIAVAQIQPL